ncbi:hypothetical protein J6590_043115 [Homalodisca vitripennis]|nr:hypothetical protein J6590_043115 [Homalodisca vitripennis]
MEDDNELVEDFMSEEDNSDSSSESSADLALTDLRQTIDLLLEISGLSWSLVQRIVTEDLGMKWVAAKIVPRVLTDNRKEHRVETCRVLKLIQIFCQRSLLVISHGAWLRPRNKATVKPMEDVILTPSKNIVKSNQTSHPVLRRSATVFIKKTQFVADRRLVLPQ